MHTSRARKRAGIAAAALAALFALGACSSSGSHDAGAAASSGAARASAAGASVTANPQFIKAKALVMHCFAGTPLQQAHQIHLVFLSSATGKNGPAVVAARTATANCMGISKADEKPFFNEAITAAEHGHLIKGGHAARVTFFGTTLPAIVIKYSNAPGVGNGTSNVPGTTPQASPSATGGTT